MLAELQQCYQTLDNMLQKYGTSREKERGYPKILAPAVPKEEVTKSDGVKYNAAFKRSLEIQRDEEFCEIMEQAAGMTASSAGTIYLVEHNKEKLVYQEVEKMKPIRYVGVGQAGINIAKNLAPTPGEVIGFVTNDGDAEKHSDCIVTNLGTGGAGRKFEKGRQRFLEEPNRGRIQVALDEINMSIVFVCWSLGGGSGSAGSSVVIKELLENKNTVFGVAVTPFTPEKTKAYLINTTLSLDAITGEVCGEYINVQGTDANGNLTTREERRPGRIGLLVAENDWLKEQALENGHGHIQVEQEDKKGTSKDPDYILANITLKDLFRNIFTFDNMFLKNNIKTQYTLDREEYKSVVWGIEDSDRRIKQGRGLYDYGIYEIDPINDEPKIDLTLSKNPPKDISSARDIMIAVAVPKDADEKTVSAAEYYLERMEALIMTEETRGRKPKKDKDGKPVKRTYRMGKSYRVVKGVVCSDDDKSKAIIIAAGMPINTIRASYHTDAKHSVRMSDDKRMPKSENTLSQEEKSFLDS